VHGAILTPVGKIKLLAAKAGASGFSTFHHVKAAGLNRISLGEALNLGPYFSQSGNQREKSAKPDFTPRLYFRTFESVNGKPPFVCNVKKAQIRLIIASFFERRQRISQVLVVLRLD